MFSSEIPQQVRRAHTTQRAVGTWGQSGCSRKVLWKSMSSKFSQYSFNIGNGSFCNVHHQAPHQLIGVSKFTFMSPGSFLLKMANIRSTPGSQALPACRPEVAHSKPAWMPVSRRDGCRLLSIHLAPNLCSSISKLCSYPVPPGKEFLAPH